MYKKKLCLALMGTVFSIASLAYAAEPIVVNNVNALQWSDVKDLPPGAKMAILAGSPQKHEPFIVRIKLPANYQIQAHSHPINEYDTVISGTLYVKFDEKGVPHETVLHAGDFVMLPAKLFHSSYAKEDTILQISGVGPWGMIHK